MIMTVDELKKYINTEVDDQVLEARLQALEASIRKATNNNFQKRAYRRTADIIGGLFIVEPLAPFLEGDTVQITGGRLNDGLFTVATVEDGIFTVSEDVVDEKNVTVTKVEYPMDVKMGVVDIMKWMLRNEASHSGDKSHREIQSESISRYSVTYATDNTESDMDTAIGVPKKYTAFLRHYKKARFY